MKKHYIYKMPHSLVVELNERHRRQVKEKSRQKIERLISENFRFGCLTQAKQAQTADRATQRVR